MAKDFEIPKGSWRVKGFTDEDEVWCTRLYGDNGLTATQTSAKHETEAEAREWAEKTLAEAP